MYREMIQRCAAGFGHPPRRSSSRNHRDYLRLDPPSWLKDDPDDGLNLLFENAEELLRNGVVVWGHLIQANSQLFQPGEKDCPAAVVYSLDPSRKIPPVDLRRIAQEIFALKGTVPSDQNRQKVARIITDEMLRFYGVAVPSVISPEYRCRFSVIQVFRKHLPGPEQCLKKGLFPIVVNPSEPFVVTILPSMFWPEDLVEWWNDEESP